MNRRLKLLKVIAHAHTYFRCLKIIFIFPHIIWGTTTTHKRKYSNFPSAKFHRLILIETKMYILINKNKKCNTYSNPKIHKSKAQETQKADYCSLGRLPPNDIEYLVQRIVNKPLRMSRRYL